MSSLTFDTSYFKDQKISNFYVPEMMKRSWAAQLQILEGLKALFDKYELKYFADFGTLLGAIRHNGIIPWDDDIDISMPRKDFNILLEHADEIGGAFLSAVSTILNPITISMRLPPIPVERSALNWTKREWRTSMVVLSFAMWIFIHWTMFTEIPRSFSFRKECTILPTNVFMTA